MHCNNVSTGIAVTHADLTYLGQQTIMAVSLILRLCAVAYSVGQTPGLYTRKVAPALPAWEKEVG